MKKSLTNVLRLTGIYVMAVVGAGFASGQEIMKFFTSYGKNSIFGILAAGLLFFLFAYLTLHTVQKHETDSYDEYVGLFFGKTFSEILKFIISLFAFCFFVVMLSAMTDLNMRIFNIGKPFSLFISGTICYITAIYGIKAINVISSFLSPILIIGCIAVCGLIIFTGRDNLVFGTSSGQGFFLAGAVLYAGYNCLSTQILLSSLGSMTDSGKTVLNSSLLSSVILTVMAFCVNGVNIIWLNTSSSKSMPVLEASFNYNVIIGYFYFLILYLAIYTSAATGIISFMDRIYSYVGKKNLIIPGIIISIAVFLAAVGFEKLVDTVYPALGYIGAGILILFIFKFFTTNI